MICDNSVEKCHIMRLFDKTMAYNKFINYDDFKKLYWIILKESLSPKKYEEIKLRLIAKRISTFWAEFCEADTLEKIRDLQAKYRPTEYFQLDTVNKSDTMALNLINLLESFDENFIIDGDCLKKIIDFIDPGKLSNDVKKIVANKLFSFIVAKKDFERVTPRHIVEICSRF